MAISKKITDLPSLAGAQVGSDLLTAVDVSQPAATQNVQSTLDLFFGNVPSPTRINTPARTTPAISQYFAARTPADLALTADTEAVGIQLGGNASLATVARQFTAGGGIALQRECVVVAPTYSATAAESIAEAATFAITGAPIAGTNMTISEAWALLVQSGKSVFIGEMAVTPNARTGSPSIVFQVVTPGDTALTASVESILNQFGGSTAQATVTRQFATGALTTQRENLFAAPTYAFVGASTLTNAATVAISGPPIAGTNATITNSYALWSQGGLSRFDGKVYGDQGSGATAAGVLMAFGGLIDSSFSATQTSGTGQTTLYTLTIGANVMGTNGDITVVDVYGRISQDGGTNADYSFNLAFDGVSLHTETQNTNSNFQHYHCHVVIQRVTTTTANIYISWNFSRYGQTISNNGANYGAQLTDQFSKVQVIPGSAVTNWTAGRAFNFNATTTNSGAPILKDGAIALKFSL